MIVVSCHAVLVTFTNSNLAMSTNNTFYEITSPGLSPSYIPNASTFTLGFDGSINDPVNARWYRFTFNLPVGYTNLRMRIRFTVDNEAQVFVNSYIAAVEDDTVVENFSSPYPDFQLNANNTVTAYTSNWDSLPVNQSMFQAGQNSIFIYATDNGGAGGFDLLLGEIEYNVVVPEQNNLILFACFAMILLIHLKKK